MMTRSQAASGGEGGNDGGRKMKGKEPADDEGAERSKRSRVDALRMELARAVVKDCEGAMAALARMEKQEKKARREADVCRCEHDRPGGTVEDALVIDDDDDDDEEEEEEVLAFILRPMLPRRLPRMAPRRNFGIPMHNPSTAELMAMRRRLATIPAGDPCAFWRMRVDRMMRPTLAHNTLPTCFSL